MIIDDKIGDEKLQYSINRETAKISALSLGKIDKYEYLAGVEILPSDQSRTIEQAEFTYSSLGKGLEKQTKKTPKDDQDLKPIERLFPKEMRTNKMKNLSIYMSIYLTI